MSDIGRRANRGSVPSPGHTRGCVPDLSSEAVPDDLDLGGAWTFAVSRTPIELGRDPLASLRAAGETPRPAVVPGNLELDLQRNGLIGDPFVGPEIVGLRDLERTYAYYVRSFEAPLRGVALPELVFEGLDCDARIILNGQLVAETRNMLIEHHIAVGDALRDGRENILVVELAPVMRRAEAMRERYAPGLAAEDGRYPGLFIRKAPHMFGWDIMPRALSAGIWRPVKLRYLGPDRIDSLWLDTERIGDREAILALHYTCAIEVSPADDVELHVIGRRGPATFEARQTLLFEAGVLRFTVRSPELWWPRGRGEAALYDVSVTLVRNGQPLDRRTFRHGIRTVALDRASAAGPDGGRFQFIVNDEPLFVLGTNWVPLDVYHSRDVERIDAAVRLVEDLGCNLIRCWGGNVYENDRFYDLCDEIGILVWQDFAMACAIYPQDPAFQSEIRDEVRQVVRRLRQHPSVLVWVGDNECDEQYVWKGRRRDPNQNVLTRAVIPTVLAAEDPSRPYLPSSPYVDPIDFASGRRDLVEDHLWGPRDYFKSPFYTHGAARFVSEIGYHGCPDVETLRRFLSPDRLWPPDDNPEWRLHATTAFPAIDRNDDRIELMARQIRALFGVVPHELDDFVYASQACQAEALRFFIDSFRGAKWERTGIIWWNLLDGWPQFSDAVVDYDFRLKRAFDAIRRAQAPISLILREPRHGRHEVVVANDTRADADITYQIDALHDGAVLLDGEATAAADAVTRLGAFKARSRQGLYVLTLETAGAVLRRPYLAGSPPFNLADYRAWLGAVGF
jgi:beta-mannosidase